MVDQSSTLRYARTQASPFRRFYDAQRQFNVDMAKKGRRQHALGITSPVGGAQSLSDVGFSAKSLGYGILSPLLRALDAPEMARQGYIPQQDMIGEAFNTAGILGGGGVASRGTGAFKYDPNTVNIFAGQRAAARLSGKRENMAKAAAMFDAGVNEGTIYNETGVFKGADGKLRYEIRDDASTINTDVSKPAVFLDDFLDHPELFETYPSLGGVRVRFEDDTSGYLGSYLPNADEIRLKTGRTPEETRSTLLHEIQHAVQNREGFSGGSNLSMSLDQAADFANKVLTSTEAKALAYNSQSFNQLYDQLGPLYTLQYHNQLDNIVNKARDGRAKPSDIVRLQDWYKYGRMIVDAQGPMPKKIGPERDSWIARAATTIKQLNIQNMGAWEKSSYQQNLGKFDSPKDLTNAIRRLERKVEKHREGAFKYRELVQRSNAAKSMDAMQAYLAEAGEVEARNVQARLDPSVATDTYGNVRFPPETAERLRNNQIVSNLREGQNLPKFSRGDRKSTGIMVLEQQVRGNNKLRDLFEAQGLDIENLQNVNPTKLQTLLDIAERRRMLNPRSAAALRKGLS